MSIEILSQLSKPLMTRSVRELDSNLPSIFGRINVFESDWVDSKGANLILFEGLLGKGSEDGWLAYTSIANYHQIELQ